MLEQRSDNDLTCSVTRIVLRALRLFHCVWQGVPEAPQCGFSNMACRILDAYGEKRSHHILNQSPASSGTAALHLWFSCFDWLGTGWDN